MSQFYLLSTVVTSTTGGKLWKAGSLIDDTQHAAITIAALKAEGGVLWPAADPVVAAAAAVVQGLWRKGADENITSRVMLAAAAQSASQNTDALTAPQAVLASADQAETPVFYLQGAGTVIGAYYLPGAASAPAAGANNQVMTLAVYKADGTSVGQLAQATLANATPMVKAARFSLGALTNATFADGYAVTAAVAHTGTATLPAGQWVIVTQPLY